MEKIVISSPQGNNAMQKTKTYVYQRKKALFLQNNEHVHKLATIITTCCLELLYQDIYLN